MTSKRLTPEEVHAVGVAALDNAVGLMNAAIVLLRANDAIRAWALGVAAAEEIAKVHACRDALRDWSGDFTVNELKEALKPGRTPHEQRYADVLERMWFSALGTVPLPPGIDDFDALARSDMRDRQQALYVDISPSGEPMTPADLSEENARLWLSGMTQHLGMMAPAWRSALEENLDGALSPREDQE